MDIRTVPGMSTEQIIVIAEEECQKYENETENILKVEIELKNDRFPIEISEDNEWVKKMNNNSFIGINFLQMHPFLFEIHQRCRYYYMVLGSRMWHINRMNTLN